MPGKQPNLISPKAYTIDARGQPSVMGQIPVRYRTWIRCFPAQAFRILVMLLALLALFALMLWQITLESGWAFAIAIPVVGLGATIWLLLVRLEENCRLGCANHAMVLSMNPPLIAVYDDLSTGGSSWPVVKILRQPLNRASGPPLQAGDRLATVSLYKGGLVTKPHWEDFYPIAVPCITDDQEAIRDLMARLDAEEGGWEMLASCLARIPQPYAPGLYWMGDSADH